MHSYHNNLLLHTFNTTFVTNRQVHSYNTRNANTYRPYFFRTNIKQLTILHLGPKPWNSLPHNLTELTSYSSFKISLEKYLIERAITLTRLTIIWQLTLNHIIKYEEPDFYKLFSFYWASSPLYLLQKLSHLILH